MARYRRNIGLPVGGGTPTVISVIGNNITEGFDAVFTVTLSNATIADTVFSYSYPGGASTNAFDFVDYNNPTFSNGVTKSGALSGTLTVPTGVSSFTVTFATVDDVFYEFSYEFFYFYVAGICTQRVNIYDNDTAPTISIGNATGVEGGNAVFTVTQSAITGTPTTFSYATSDGTAIAGSDYISTSGTGSIAAGLTTTTISVPILNDLVSDGSETFTVTISSPTYATIGTATGTGTITNLATPTISTVTSPSVEEGNNLVFTVTTSGSYGITTTHTYALSGTAVAPSDYSATPTFSNGVTESGGTLSVPSGVSSFTATYTTVVNGDNGETVILTVGGIAGTGTISQLGMTPIGDSGSPIALTALTGLVI